MVCLERTSSLIGKDLQLVMPFGVCLTLLRSVLDREQQASVV